MVDNVGHPVGQLTSAIRPEDRDLLWGALAAMQHFAEDAPQGMTRVPRPDIPEENMYTVLEESEKVLQAGIANGSIPEGPAREIASKDLARFQATLKFIRENVEEEEFRFRSALVEAAREKASMADQAMQEDIFTARATGASAWNTAVQHSLGAPGGSIERLQGSAAPGFYLDDLVEFVYTKPVRRRKQRMLKNFSARRPVASTMSALKRSNERTDLTWEKIRDIVEKTGNSRELLQRARGSGNDEDIEENFRTHAWAIAEQLGTNTLKPLHRFISQGAPEILGGSFGAAYFKEDALGVAVGVTAGMLVGGVIEKPWEFLRAEELHASETVVVNTLSDEYERAMELHHLGSGNEKSSRRSVVHG
jgi:hypothetical protein